MERRDYRNFLPREERIQTPGGELRIAFDARAYGETHGRDVFGSHPETEVVKNVRFEGPKGSTALSDVFPLAAIEASVIHSASRPLAWGTSVHHESAEMLIGPLHDPFVLASLSHELGHSDQHRFDEFTRMEVWYAPNERRDAILLPSIITRITADAHYVCNPEEIAALDELKQTMLAIIRQERVLGLKDGAHTDYYGRDRELDALYSTRHAILWEKLRNAIFSAHILLEKDATDRALQWMGVIGQRTGIDLLDTPFVLPENKQWAFQHTYTHIAKQYAEPGDTMTLRRALELAIRSHSDIKIPNLHA